MKLVQKALHSCNKEFLRFCTVGGASTIINYGLFYFLLIFLSANYLFSSASGYILGTLFGFYINKIFTFRSKSKKHGVEITKYFTVYIMSLVAGLALLKGQVSFGAPVLLANFIVIGFTTTINYLGSKYFVFSKTSIIKTLDYKVYKYRHFLRYFLIGTISVIIELGIIILLRDFIETKILIATGFIIGMLFAFFVNLNFNFEIQKKDNLKAFVYFILIAVLVYILNILAINLFLRFDILNYSFSRLFTAAIFFMLSYILHRNITFKNTKKVGIAIYLQKDTNITNIKKKVGGFIDWIHLDLIDETFKEEGARKVDISIGYKAKALWPGLKIMTHIMSKNPSRWINTVSPFSDYIIIHTMSEESLRENIRKIKELGKKVGICVMSKEVFDIPKDILKQIDLVQVLGIDNPGSYGQEMNKATIPLLEKLRLLKRQWHFDICLDGGVKKSNIDSINSKYIVSGSTILNSINPRQTIYNLKTSIKYARKKRLKRFLGTQIFEKLSNKDYIKSITLVGSFVDKEGLTGISDLDIVVILDKLNKKRFKDLIYSLEKIRNPLKNQWGYNMKINPTLGPLKFNDKRTVVFHLMMYDVKGHVEHCIKSPFTCIDWQRSPIYKRMSMSDIWPINKLQPNYFFNSRRSLGDYLSDLKEGVISYREYDFSNSKVEEKISYKKMTNKDKHEFAFHIIRFCMLNLLKLKNHKNKYIEIGNLSTEYFKIFPKNKNKYIKLIKKLKKQKSKNKFRHWSERDYNLIHSFLRDFEYQFRKYFFENSTKIYFVRHQKTKLNKGTLFLGQELNPSIIKTKKEEVEKFSKLISEKSTFISSPSKRAIETANLFSEKVELNDLLKEINYGDAEGCDLITLNKKFPEIIASWKKGEDPKFPNGENNSDVRMRLRNFLKYLAGNIKSDANTLVFSHNVFLRCLLGEFYRVPMKEWYKINIPHIEPLEIIMTNDKHFYINLSKNQIKKIFKAFIPK